MLFEVATRLTPPWVRIPDVQRLDKSRGSGFDLFGMGGVGGDGGLCVEVDYLLCAQGRWLRDNAPNWVVSRNNALTLVKILARARTHGSAASPSAPSTAVCLCGRLSRCRDCPSSFVAVLQCLPCGVGVYGVQLLFVRVFFVVVERLEHAQVFLSLSLFECLARIGVPRSVVFDLLS